LGLAADLPDLLDMLRSVRSHQPEKALAAFLAGRQERGRILESNLRDGNCDRPYADPFELPFWFAFLQLASEDASGVELVRLIKTLKPMMVVDTSDNATTEKSGGDGPVGESEFNQLRRDHLQPLDCLPSHRTLSVALYFWQKIHL
jgi:hypothetical protein